MKAQNDVMLPMFMKQTVLFLCRRNLTQLKVSYIFLNRLGYNIINGAKNDPKSVIILFPIVLPNYRNLNKTAIKLLKSLSAEGSHPNGNK